MRLRQEPIKFLFSKFRESQYFAQIFNVHFVRDREKISVNIDANGSKKAQSLS